MAVCFDANGGRHNHAPNQQMSGTNWEDEYPPLVGIVGVTVLINKYTGAPVLYDEHFAERSDVYQVFPGTLAEAEAAFEARQLQGDVPLTPMMAVPPIEVAGALEAMPQL